MKPEVYLPKEKNEYVVRFALKSSNDGSMLLHVVDSEGNPVPGGDILSITTAGRLLLHTAITVPGIATDAYGMIVVSRWV